MRPNMTAFRKGPQRAGAAAISQIDGRPGHHVGTRSLHGEMGYLAAVVP